MPDHRTPTVFLLPVLLAGGACAGNVVAQGCEIVFTLTDLASNGLSASVALGDLDGDGDLDAMVANFEGQPNTVWTNDGNGTFTNSGTDTRKQLEQVRRPRRPRRRRRPRCHDRELQNQPNTVWTNDGNGTFTNSGRHLETATAPQSPSATSTATATSMPWSRTSASPTPSGPTTATAPSPTPDRHSETATATQSPSATSTATATSMPWSRTGATSPTPSGPTTATAPSPTPDRHSETALSFSVALGDLDGDGDLDAMVAEGYNQPNTVWTNDGTGTFTNSGQTLGNRWTATQSPLATSTATD